jgi:hypothetical protein
LRNENAVVDGARKRGDVVRGGTKYFCCRALGELHPRSFGARNEVLLLILILLIIVFLILIFIVILLWLRGAIGPFTSQSTFDETRALPPRM